MDPYYKRRGKDLSWGAFALLIATLSFVTFGVMETCRRLDPPEQKTTKVIAQLTWNTSHASWSAKAIATDGTECSIPHVPMHVGDSLFCAWQPYVELR